MTHSKGTHFTIAGTLTEATVNLWQTDQLMLLGNSTSVSVATEWIGVGFTWHFDRRSAG